MVKPRKTARTRTYARQRRLRERSTVFAASLSASTVLLVGLLTFIVLTNIPGTAIRNFWLLVMVNGQVSPSSELYRSLFAQIERQEALFVSPICLLAGGLVLGRLMPRRIPRPRLLRTAALVAVGVVVACVLFRWSLILWGQHGRLHAGEIDTQIELTQVVCSLGWIIAYLVGTWIGVQWRDVGHHAEENHSKTDTLSLSR